MDLSWTSSAVLAAGSAELIVSLVAAGMSAAASIVGAIIQASGKKRPEEDPGAERTLTARITRKIDFGEADSGRRGVDGVWLALAVVLVLETLVLALSGRERASTFAAELNALVLVPAVTFLLALARPIGWGYAAGAVTALHAAVVAVSALAGGGGLDTSPQMFVLSFVANALLVSGVAFLRTRARPRAVGGALLACGVLALAWLFVPLLAAAGGGSGPRREPPVVEPEPDGHPGVVRPVRVREIERIRRPPSRNFARDSVLFSPAVRAKLERGEPGG
jgi:hypothetical protein